MKKKKPKNYYWPWQPLRKWLQLETKLLENFPTDKTGENGENSKNEKKGEYPEINFIQVPYIWYPITFQEKSVLALFDLRTEVNAIYPTFAKELDLSIRPIDVEAQKIYNTMLDTVNIE